MKEAPIHFLVSQTDKIGDVVVSQPFLNKLKQHYPQSTMTVIGCRLTQPVIALYQAVDHFIAVEDLLAKTDSERIAYLKALKCDIFLPICPNQTVMLWGAQAEIPLRVGRIQKHYPFWLFNRFIFLLWFRNPKIHEAERFLHFLKPLGYPSKLSHDELARLVRLKLPRVSPSVQALLNPKQFHLILHPSVNGVTSPWPKANFIRLLQMLPKDVQIFITGTAQEGTFFSDLATYHPNVVPLFGQQSLNELMELLSLADGVVAGSTGPMHLASALGRPVIALFPAQHKRNHHRWGGLGKHAINISAPHCLKSLRKKPCDCMEKISPESVYQQMEDQWGIGKRQA